MLDAAHTLAWKMRWLHMLLSPIRSIGRTLFANHWFFTLASAVCIAAFISIALNLLPEYTLPTDPSSLPNLWLLGAGAALFTLLAAVSWLEKSRSNGLTEEELEELYRWRFAEIQSWLVRRVTVEDARKMLVADHHVIGIRYRDPEIIAPFDEWFARNASTENELWYYSTDEESWANLCGENGFALVRNGQVVQFMMWLMN